MCWMWTGRSNGFYVKNTQQAQTGVKYPSWVLYAGGIDYLTVVFTVVFPRSNVNVKPTLFRAPSITLHHHVLGPRYYRIFLIVAIRYQLTVGRRLRYSKRSILPIGASIPHQRKYDMAHATSCCAALTLNTIVSARLEKSWLQHCHRCVNPKKCALHGSIK